MQHFHKYKPHTPILSHQAQPAMRAKKESLPENDGVHEPVCRHHVVQQERKKSSIQKPDNGEDATCVARWGFPNHYASSNWVSWMSWFTGLLEHLLMTNLPLSFLTPSLVVILTPPGRLCLCVCVCGGIPACTSDHHERR